MQRLFDTVFAFAVLVLFSPLIVLSLVAVWLYDFGSPFYVASRVGENQKIFKMLKIRSMNIEQGKSAALSTSGDDSRITPVGRVIRKFKIDELAQFLNVLSGNMSIVGPRPLPHSDFDKLNEFEKSGYLRKPGITDFSSIVFNDEAKILLNSEFLDPDLAYNLLIRPWKSRFVLFYDRNSSAILNIKIIALTALSIISSQKAKKIVSKIIYDLGANQDLSDAARREGQLELIQPPQKLSDIIR